MEVIKAKLEGCFIIKPNVFEDSRGYFMETFNKDLFADKTGINTDFVQDNQSFSSYGVIRGLHAQTGKFAQAKLVRVLEGEVLDVVVDIRPCSKTYLEHIAVHLSAENKTQFYVPRGFLHGFAVLSESATFFYKCDNYYDKASEIGVLYDDPQLNIDWKIPEEERIISEKDMNLPLIKKIINKI
jgi:dTDP-4-dehydrorhamnose 3,5-epimerase